MKQLLQLLLGLSLAGTASAQAPLNVERPGSSASVDPSWMLDPIDRPFHSSAAAPQGEQITLTYANPEGTLFTWDAPLALDQTTFVLAYAQRFTLPTEQGTLDSVKIQFGAVQDNAGGQGSVTVYLLKDAPTADFHFPDLSQTGVLGSAVIPTSVFGSATSLSLNLATPGLVVPKEFFVFVSPTYVTQGNTSNIKLPSEVKFNTPRSRENSRSIILLSNGTQQSFSIMDNSFRVPTDTAVVNFLIEAFVNVESGSVASNETTSAAMFPNPVALNGTLNIQHDQPINSIRIVNMLGAEVQSWTGKSSNVSILTSELTTGVYNVIVTTDSGVTTEKLVVH